MATDRQTGIRSGRATVTVTFTCLSRPYRGAGVDQRPDRVVFTPTFGSVAAVGSTTSSVEFGLVEFTLEDLWNRGGCPVNVLDTELAVMNIAYSVTAVNNRGRRAAPLAGNIYIFQTYVAIDGRPTPTTL